MEGHRHGTDPELLWRRPAAAASIQPLAWELPYAEGAALERQKEKEKAKSCVFAKSNKINDPLARKGEGIRNSRNDEGNISIDI